MSVLSLNCYILQQQHQQQENLTMYIVRFMPTRDRICFIFLNAHIYRKLLMVYSMIAYMMTLSVVHLNCVLHKM